RDPPFFFNHGERSFLRSWNQGCSTRSLGAPWGRRSCASEGRAPTIIFRAVENARAGGDDRRPSRVAILRYSRGAVAVVDVPLYSGWFQAEPRRPPMRIDCFVTAAALAALVLSPGWAGAQQARPNAGGAPAATSRPSPPGPYRQVSVALPKPYGDPSL